jgi:hypothetical protein
MSDYNFQNLLTPQGYYEKLSADIVSGNWMVRGSVNTLIAENGKVMTRKGYTLVGQAGTIYGTKSSRTWQTSSGIERPLRSRYDRLQVLYNGSWITYKAGFGNSVKFVYDTWWDKTEGKDKLLFVNGGTKIYSTLGGITEIAGATATTLTKKYANASTVPNPFTFDATLKTITQTNTTWVSLGFAVGDTITVGNSTSNNGVYTIKTLTTTVITVSNEDTLVNETNTTGAIVAIQGKQTWSQERFPTTGTKRLVIDGVVFTYTGGETTQTLTGVTPDPTTNGVVAGSVATADVYESTPSGGDIIAASEFDLIRTNKNQAYIGNKTRREVYLSTQTDFASYAYTLALRKPGEGGTVTLDNALVGMRVTDEGEMHVSAGRDDWYKITLDSVTSGGVVGEEIRVKKFKTSHGQGANNHNAIINTKNGIAFLSKEPTVDYIARLEQITTQQSKPISDDIKELLLRLDTTDVQTEYWQNNIWFLFPSESVLLAYDQERGFWQPPQLISGASLSIIDGWLHVHSSTSDETYKLFDGISDNGAPITFKGVFNYQNGGTRTDYKTMSGYFVELMANPAASDIKVSVALGYNGSVGVYSDFLSPFDGAPFVDDVAFVGGFGGTPFGTNTIGNFAQVYTDDDPDFGLFRKVRKIIPVDYNGKEWFEMQVMIELDALGSAFALISHGSDMRLSGSHNTNLIQTVI